MNTVFLDFGTFGGTLGATSDGNLRGASGTGLNPSTLNLDLIEQAASSLSVFDFTDPSQLIARAQHADVIITNKVILNAKSLAQLTKLKLICVAATGTNNIDLVAAKQHGITVCHAKDYAGPAVAQYIFAQLLQLFHNIPHHNANTRQNHWSQSHWSQSRSFCLHSQPIYELAGKTIGLIGYGHIAQAVEHIANAFNMRVLIAERPNQSHIRGGRLPFEQVLAQADVLTLHCPLSASTEHLFNRERFSLMKPNAILINTARGGLIDDNALLDALTSGQLAHAIIDVLDQEPPPSNHPLLSSKLANLTITGHIAWASQEAQQRIIDIVAANMTAFANNVPINTVVSV
ncbi:D-2-hydroxyacid dehydrogenase [Thalassotalea euphylliae]|uniref:D-2-hydroxyacid dehydrogenase n=1 Tax=Thalassotalea euphylliae TaxID=1655234 RepID=A0A3E0TMU6_9GAMM|nr:D-2-hydroxyacid dehydrogenase [Thalassotalea euphylliae]REL25818.1 D-2-hydroxyacid dehydrogenase [Thalassotalea euphylliae]